MKHEIYKFLNIINKSKNNIKRKINILLPELYEIFILNPTKKEKDKLCKASLSKELKSLMEQKPFPLPTEIEIETRNRCNADCDFCPINKNIDPREFAKMDDELFYSIISQLKELNYSGYIACYSNNEPLLDKRIFDFVEHIKQELPNAKNFLFTNGILLNLEKFRHLMLYLDYLVIDNYYEDNESINENIKEIAEYCLKDKKLQSKVKIQPINKHMIRTNRGGNAKNRKHTYRIQSSCLWPFSQIVIRPTGQLSLCCNDALGSMTMGDLTKERLIDIWRGEKYMKLRRSLLETRQTVDLCAKCDNFGLIKRDEAVGVYKIGQNWKKIKELLET